MGLKERISSPLEAGPSVLDGHHLPPHLTPALEYASARLAKKSVHLTLVVVRQDNHVSTTPVSSPLSATSCSSYSASASATSSSSSSAASSTGLSVASLSSSLSKLSFATGSVTALKQLVRSRSCRLAAADHRARSNATRHTSSTTTKTAPTTGNPGAGSSGLGISWPLSPTTIPLASPTPMTPCTPSSIVTTTRTDLLGPPTPGGSPSLCFLHAPDLSPRDQKIQRAVFAKTAHKFNLSLLLHPAANPTAYGLSSQLFTNSIIQHDVLFSSEGLTILSLDRLYTLKAALASYARNKTPLRLEAAVDELRRYVLASHGAKVSRSDLCRAYDWLNVGPGAVADLDGMYRRAYGGPDQVGAIAGIETNAHPPPPAASSFPPSRSPPSPPSPARSPSPTYYDHNPEADGYASSFHHDQGQDAELPPEQIGLAVTTFSETTSIRSPSSSRGSTLTVQTKFQPASRPLVLRSKWGYEDDDEDEGDEDDIDCSNGNNHHSHYTTTSSPQDHDSIPKPRTQDSPLPSTMGFVSWKCSNSLDRQLSRGTGLANADGDVFTQQQGPMTPNGYEDISPITRNEWGFLMVNESLKGGKTVNVETC
ncbi:hypothetical protein E4U21_005309 [Claviceps maximensis]|nr:hypothetical protein E4U21_005309 [Claviceps maximensis]